MRPAAPHPEIVAHRGYSARAPENTLAAIEGALRAGADGVEFDVHTASCGTPVLIHDEHLGRTTNGVGPVRRRTFDQLRALDAGRWFSQAFEGERIPGLAAALERISVSPGVLVYAEVKGYRELEDLDRMVSVVRDAGMTGRTAFLSMDWHALDRIAHRDEGLALGYIVERSERMAEGTDRAGGDPRAHLAVDARCLLEDLGLLEEPLRKGVEVGAWTVNDPDGADLLWKEGVTRFTTDEVETLLRWRSSLRRSD